MRPSGTIEVCRRSHRRLLAGLAPLSDQDCVSPSLLPGYSRGHVVTHLANKAGAHVLLVDGAAAGVVGRVHPDGYDQDAAADLGARRSANERRTDLAEGFELLEAAWDALADHAWAGQALMAAGLRTMAEVVAHHLRNVEVHHVDLAIGHRPCDWPALLVEGELPKRLQSLLGRADRADLLAWPFGRAPAPKLSGPW